MVPKPQCTNHDDGETGAQIVCSECGPLCIDCDRVLHLSRKFRSHQRQVKFSSNNSVLSSNFQYICMLQVCKEEEGAIKVDVHEGCGRVKLFWILALSDARTLKSLVEFRHGAATNTIFNSVTHQYESGNYSCTSVLGIRHSSCRYCGSAITPTSASLFDDQSVNVCSESDCQVISSSNQH